MDMQSNSEIQNPVSLDKKPKKIFKILIIIGSALLFLLATGFVIWYFIYNSISLTRYDNSGYSIIVPQSYIKSESSTGDVDFYKSGSKDENNRSSVKVSSVSISSLFRPHFADSLDKTISKDNIEKISSNDGSLRKTNVVVNKTKKGDIDVWTVDGDLPDSGKFRSVTLLNTSKVYTVTVLCRNDEPKLVDSAVKITDSFVIK